MKRKINETQLEVILCSLILLSGLYTPIARNFIPVAGGGMSLIFVLTVPALIVLSFIFIGIHIIAFKKDVRTPVLVVASVCFSLLLIVLGIAFYPYA